MSAGIKHSLNIDRLRGLFAICVATGHTYDLARLQAPVDTATNVVATARGFLGFSWVVGFIVLSGFCIANSTMGGYKSFSFVRYIIMRITRIFPLLICCTLITAVFEYLMLGSIYRPAMWTAGVNLANMRASFFGMSGFYAQFGSSAPSYTVSYELLYYLLFGCALFLARTPGTTILLSIAFATFLYIFSSQFGPILSDELGPVLTEWVTMLFFLWLIGTLLFYYQNRICALVRGTPRLFVWIVWLIYSITIANYGGHPRYADATVVSFLAYIGLGLAYAYIIAVYLADEKESGSPWFDRWMGEISYPLFVIHGPVIVFSGFLLSRFGFRPTFLVYMGLGVAASLLAAQLLAAFIERPIMKWRRNVLSKKTLPAVVTGPLARD